MKESGGLKARGITKKSKDGKPLVSIVTPVFNGQLFLEQTIRSVIGQNYENIEYIIIDGCSADGSLEIIRKYEDKVDYWLSEPDSGMYDAINKGLKVASGDILAYLNSDDLYYPDTVKIAVEYFQRHPDAELIYGNCDFINAKSEFLYTYRYPKFKWNFFVSRNISSIPQQTTFWRSAIHEKIGYFDATLKMCGDFDFYAKAGQRCRIDHTERNLARFRLHGASQTATTGYKNKGEVAIIHKRYLDFGRIERIFLRFWIELQVKCLNLPAMLRKTYHCFRKIHI